MATEDDNQTNATLVKALINHIENFERRVNEIKDMSQLRKHFNDQCQGLATSVRNRYTNMNLDLPENINSLINNLEGEPKEPYIEWVNDIMKKVSETKNVLEQQVLALSPSHKPLAGAAQDDKEPDNEEVIVYAQIPDNEAKPEIVTAATPAEGKSTDPYPAFTEFLETEEKYIESLYVLIDAKDDFENFPGHKEFIEIIEQSIEGHLKLMWDLQKEIKNSPPNLAEILETFKQTESIDQKCMIAYKRLEAAKIPSNQKEAYQKANIRLKDKPGQHDFMARAAPVFQRVGKYPLLARELEKKLPENSPAKEGANLFFNESMNRVDRTNENVRMYEKYQAQFSQRVRATVDALVQGVRSFELPRRPKIAGFNVDKLKALLSKVNERRQTGDVSAPPVPSNPAEAWWHQLDSHIGSSKPRAKLAADVAEDLVQENMSLMAKIEPDELKNKNFERETKSPNYQNLVKHSNSITKSVQEDILAARGRKEQVNIYKFYIDLAQASMEKGDFLTMFSIVTGLSSPSVGRLFKDEDLAAGLISKKQLKTLNKMLATLDPSASSKNYRELEKAAQGAIVPRLDVLAKDLIFIYDGSSTDAGRIAGTEEAVDAFLEMQQRLPPQAREAPVQTKYGARVTLPHLDDNAVYHLSEEIQPRGKKQFKSPIDSVRDRISSNIAQATPAEVRGVRLEESGEEVMQQIPRDIIQRATTEADSKQDITAIFDETENVVQSFRDDMEYIENTPSTAPKEGDYLDEMMDELENFIENDEHELKDVPEPLKAETQPVSQTPAPNTKEPETVNPASRDKQPEGPTSPNSTTPQPAPKEAQKKSARKTLSAKIKEASASVKSSIRGNHNKK